MLKILPPCFLVLSAIISAQAMATEVVVLDELILGESTFADVEAFSQDHHCLLQKQDIPERAVDTYNKIFLNPTLYKLQNCSLNLKRVKDIDLVFEERYLNKSVKPKEIEESLNNKFLKAEEQLSFIEASLPEDELQAEQVIQLFCKTLDLSKATERINEIKEAKAKLQEKVNAQIEQSKQAQAMNQTTIPQSQLEAHESQSQTQARRYCVFRFEGYVEELQAFNPILNQFIKEHDVKVSILEKGEC